MNTTRDNYNRMRLDDILEHSSISVDTRNCVMELLDQVEDTNLRQVLRIEVKRMLGDHDRLVSSLRQHIEMLDNENTEHKAICNEYQRRYEKAVREMQFFKRKYDVTKEQLQKPSDSLKPGYIQALSQSKSQPTRANLPIDQSEYPPFDPMGDFGRQGLQANTFVANSPTWPGSPMSVVSDSTSLSTPRYRQNSTAANSLFSLQSSSTDSQSVYSAKQPADVLHEKSSWASRQIDLPFRSNGSVSSGNSVHSAPNAPRSLAAAVSDYSTLTRVQQRQLEPLSFGGSDGLWDTISKSKESDMTIEKMISNFLRRGGSPNTAKQSSTAQLVKYGYGLIHALIATKSPSSLDLLLQHGANPNCMTLSQTADDRMTPCYMAARLGWLPGLQMLVKAGGDLVSARGGGLNKTALHVASEHCHSVVVEYIDSVTRGALRAEVDNQGATALHYACASGHAGLVSFLISACHISVKQKDNREESPLHWAARHGRLEVVTLLIERFGCDINSYVHKKVNTPYDMAKSGGHKRLVDYLKKLGALTTKKADKRHEEEMEKLLPNHLEQTLAKNGIFFDGF